MAYAGGRGERQQELAWAKYTSRMFTRYTLMSALVMAASPLRAEAGDFNGRWNITVENEPRGRAWWLEVEAAGTRALRGKWRIDDRAARALAPANTASYLARPARPWVSYVLNDNGRLARHARTRTRRV